MNTIASLNSALAGRYEVEGEIGSGGMATVYRARDVRHKRLVAVHERSIAGGSDIAE